MNRVGGVDEALDYVMDTDLGLKLALIGPPISVDEPVVYARTHPRAKTYFYSSKRARERLRITKKLFEDENMPDRYRRCRRKAYATAHEYAWKNYFAGKEAWKALRHAILDDIYSRRIDFRWWASWRVVKLHVERWFGTKRGGGGVRRPG